MTPFPKRGLYAITQTDNKTAEQILDDVAAAIRGGITVLQYRDKNPDDAVYLARQLLSLCRQARIPLIINDSVELAAHIGADGVHLGKDDGAIQNARAQLGPSAIIGVSCYNDLQRAEAAQSEGSSYVAFGRFFPSSSKPLAAPAELITLQQAKQNIHIPIVAIGGILPENAQTLLNAGADVLAVIGGIFDRNPETSAQAFLQLF